MNPALPLAFVLAALALQLPAQQSITYEESLENFANPERGLPMRVDPPWPEVPWEQIPWAFCEQDEDVYTWTAWTEPLDVSAMRAARGRGESVVMARYHLADFRRRDLTTDFLAHLGADFDAAREAGVKVVPRFAYNYPKGGPDTDVEWVLRHLEQLRPVFTEHADVIAFADLGLIGCWGEGHTSSNELMDASRGYRRLNASTIAIIEKFFDVLPPERMIAVRYPEYKFQYFNGLSDDPQVENAPIAPVAPADAFDESIRSRWGQHDDCWACGEWNAGTYFNPYAAANGGSAVVRDFLTEDNRYTVQSGEVGATCCELPEEPTDEDGDGWVGDYEACARIAPLFRDMRVSTTNHNDDPLRIARWRDEGCYEAIAREMGYRFVLRSATVPAGGRAGDSATVSVTLSNVGYARPFNPRAVELVLRSRVDGAAWRLPVDLGGVDARLWLPGPDATAELALPVALPTGLPAGEYDVLLNLPDPAPRLNTRPEYSMQLANVGVWEAATGFNALGAVLAVRQGAEAPFATVADGTYEIPPRGHGRAGLGGRQGQRRQRLPCR